MKKKLLVVNLQNPNDSRYYPCSDAASLYFLGRRMSNYLLFVVGQDGSADRIVLPEVLDLATLEKILKDSLGRS